MDINKKQRKVKNEEIRENEEIRLCGRISTISVQFYLLSFILFIM